ncbi:MAG: aldehyde dehydrogenase family protein [Acidobacteria bacterium]|nr:MAG: aldehyde dehydrogenase family protein [Acidobacteriota bacterium]
MDVRAILEELELDADVLDGVGGAPHRETAGGAESVSINPATGEPIATVRGLDADGVERVVARAQRTFETWRSVPAPRRGELVRDLGNALREKKQALGALVSLEMGKILPEGLGEVQEMIDICDFAVGLSRQLYGLTMPSERPDHRIQERWHPLGPVGVITAFNFPVAVWSWNAAIAAVCGDTLVWKPSSETPLCALAVQRICDRVMEAHDAWGVFNVAIGPGRVVGEALIRDRRIPLVSFTGSCEMGRHVATAVADRFGRSILELGGNNAVIVLDDADLEMAARAITFGAVGTAGQRCTSTRRVLATPGIIGPLTERLLEIYAKVPIGDPLDESTLMGPLVNEAAVETMMKALDEIRRDGGEILFGGRRLDGPGYFVEPALVRARASMPIVSCETFAPILYLIEVADLDEAIAVNNGVPQGLSSAIFTTDFRAAERFLSERGSDCGLANVNTGTSGAEIGGAFGGEKETGGGRESGSDSWKAYMRRQTATINFGTALPLAQGIKFGD